MSNTAESQNEGTTSTGAGDLEVLVVVSKLKNYIRTVSGMNTSGSVAEKVSEIVRTHCAKAIENAKNDGRKTVMDRDFTTLS